MYKIQTLNNISLAGLDLMPRDEYEVASEMLEPDAILLRSAKIHDLDVPASLKAVGRAGAGVNNIPVKQLSELGIPVFNSPGANANAVKELVLAGMFMAARNVCQAWKYARELEGTDQEINKKVESGKKNFVGFELPGRTFGVVGLGAIGIKVANAALKLGMNVIGYDPSITVQRAWKLSSEVEQALSIDDLLSQADVVTFHVPLLETTRHLINSDRVEVIKEDAIILNFSRPEIVDEAAVLNGLDQGKISSYVCDFPNNQLKDHDKVITLPHLGASTKEAEDNCAVMVTRQIKSFLEKGNIRNAVNLPDVVMPKSSGYRIGVFNSNVPNMVGQISTTLADHGLNIVDLINKSSGDLAYTLADVDKHIPDSVVSEISAIEGVLSVRVIID